MPSTNSRAGKIPATCLWQDCIAFAWSRICHEGKKIRCAHPNHWQNRDWTSIPDDFLRKHIWRINVPKFEVPPHGTYYARFKIQFSKNQSKPNSGEIKLQNNAHQDLNVYFCGWHGDTAKNDYQPPRIPYWWSEGCFLVRRIIFSLFLLFIFIFIFFFLVPGTSTFFGTTHNETGFCLWDPFHVFPNFGSLRHLHRRMVQPSEALWRQFNYRMCQR